MTKLQKIEMTQIAQSESVDLQLFEAFTNLARDLPHEPSGAQYALKRGLADATGAIQSHSENPLGAGMLPDLT